MPGHCHDSAVTQTTEPCQEPREPWLIFLCCLFGFPWSRWLSCFAFLGTYLILFKVLTWRLISQSPQIVGSATLQPVPGSPGLEIFWAFLGGVGFFSGLGGIRDLTCCCYSARGGGGSPLPLWSLSLQPVSWLLWFSPSCVGAPLVAWGWQMFWDLAGHAHLMQMRCWTERLLKWLTLSRAPARRPLADGVSPEWFWTVFGDSVLGAGHRDHVELFAAEPDIALQLCFLQKPCFSWK